MNMPTPRDICRADSVPVWGMVKRPNGIDAQAAGALALAGYSRQDRDRHRRTRTPAGDTVLICGATGGDRCDRHPTGEVGRRFGDRDRGDARRGGIRSRPRRR